MDPSSVNELIPQIFDEMRFNLGNKGSERKGPGRNTTSAITTQSLLKELEYLDKIIPMIENVDSSLKSALPSHLDKIHDICKSTNALLDSWINIHSQAGYIHKMMGSTKYLEYISKDTAEDQTLNPREVIKTEETEIERLKQEIAKEKEKQNTVGKDVPLNLKASSIPTTTWADKNKRRRTVAVSKPIRPNVSRVQSRLTKPTVSSSRKMFR